MEGMCNVLLTPYFDLPPSLAIRKTGEVGILDIAGKLGREYPGSCEFDRGDTFECGQIARVLSTVQRSDTGTSEKHQVHVLCWKPLEWDPCNGVKARALP